jgi:hypothetical protein
LSAQHLGFKRHQRLRSHANWARRVRYTASGVLTLSEIGAASTVSQHNFNAGPQRQSRTFGTDDALLQSANNGSDAEWHCPKRFVKIWPSMNHSETGLLQGTIEGRRSSEIPVRALVRQKRKHPFRAASSDAYAEKKLSEHSHRRPTFQVCIVKLNRRSPRLLGRNVSFTGLRSIQHWRIAD